MAQQRTYEPPPADGGMEFDVLAAKLLPPGVRRGTVWRHSLIDRTARSGGAPIVVVAAPAGYGKSTFLSQWAERDARPFAWVSVDVNDNDPKVLLSYVAEALNSVEPVARPVFDALASPGSSVPGSVVPRLGSAFASMTTPVVLVLDDVHVLHDPEGRAALSTLADHVPAGSQLVLAGRTRPPLRIARLRAEGRVTEIGASDLSLTVEEAARLLSAAAVAVPDDDVVALHARTEGWPVGLYLAALCLREGGTTRGAAASFGGDDVFVSEYVESELLAQMSRSDRAFLTRTAVLERMSGPLCEAVLDVPGSAEVLTAMADANLLLVPLDRRGRWYRYHHLLRDLLRADLEREDPDLLPVLRRRAAAWYLQHDMPEQAVEYSILAGDVETVAGLLQQLFSPVYLQGRIDTLQRWFGWLDERGGVERYPLNAMHAAFLAEKTGHPAQAERWAVTVDRIQSDDPTRISDPVLLAMAATLRAISCRAGPEQMRADADEAANHFAAAGRAYPVSPLLQGTARLLCGDPDGADAFFALAESMKEDPDAAHDIIGLALSERSLLAVARDQWDRAEAFADSARTHLRRAGFEDSYATPLISAAQAGVALHRGDLEVAQRELVTARRLRPLTTYAHPHWAVQARLELIRVQSALGDLAGARTLMVEIREILARRPDLGTLVAEVDAAQAQLAGGREHGVGGASALTAAELRVLPLLSTYLSIPEIAEKLFLSPNTVKTQVRSIYQRLDVSSRSECVARARELGLLEG